MAGAVHPNHPLTVYFADKPISDNMMRPSFIKNNEKTFDNMMRSIFILKIDLLIYVHINCNLQKSLILGNCWSPDITTSPSSFIFQ